MREWICLETAGNSLVDLLQKTAAILDRGIIVAVFVALQEKTAHGGGPVFVLQTVLVDDSHSGCRISAAQISDQGIGGGIVAHGDHGIEIVVKIVSAVRCGQTVIPFVHSPHDEQLDQAGGLHRSVVDGI